MRQELERFVGNIWKRVRGEGDNVNITTWDLEMRRMRGSGFYKDRNPNFLPTPMNRARELRALARHIKVEQRMKEKMDEKAMDGLI